jgi:hypothetical protein
MERFPLSICDIGVLKVLDRQWRIPSQYAELKKLEANIITNLDDIAASLWKAKETLRGFMLSWTSLTDI